MIIAPARRRRVSGDAIALGSPPLVLRDEDRESIEDAIAELLVATLEREGVEAPAR